MATTALIVGAVIAAVGVGVSAYAASEAAHQQEQAAKYNKRIAENQATAARQAAEVAAQQRQEHLRRVLAAQRAAINASNVMDTSGSPLLVEIDSARQAALEVERIRYGGQETALGFEAQGRQAKYLGQQAAKASYVQAGASLLAGTGQIATSYYRGGRPVSTTGGE